METQTSGLANRHKGLRTLFINELQEINRAEMRVVQALPNMIEYASNKPLKDSLEKHFAFTAAVLISLKEIFFLIGEKECDTACTAIENVVSHSLQIVSKIENGNVRDVSIILAVLKIDHFQIATYETLCSFAKILEKHDIRSLLLKILEEKNSANEALGRIVGNIEPEMMDLYNE